MLCYITQHDTCYIKHMLYETRYIAYNDTCYIT